MKGALANGLLACVSVVVALGIGEIGLRAAGYRPGNPLGRLINHPDPYLGYRMVPGMHETVPGEAGIYSVDIVDLGFPDNIGFRDDGITGPVDSVFIGDSFVWGYNVDLKEAISERYEAITGRDAVNLGMTSWTSPTQYARVLAKYGVPLKPRFAFMEALVENDFGDLPNFAAWEAAGGAKSYPEWMTDRVRHYTPDSWNYRIRRWLYDHSAVGRLLSDRVQFGFADARIRESDPNIVHVTGPGLDLHLDRRQIPPPGTAPDQAQVELFRRALLASKAAAEGNGIRLVVFVIPTKEMVYQDRFPDPATRNAVDWRYAALTQLLNETGIAHVDLLPALRAAAATGGQLYFDYDTHWTERGHEVAAQALRRFMATFCNQADCYGTPAAS